MGFKEKSDSQAVLDVEVSGDSPDLDEHYEPHDYQPPGKSASYCEALFILVKASLGTGILCMPRAFYNAGYVLGAVGTIFAGVISVLSVHLIANTEHELCRRKRIPRMTYPETLEASFEMGPGNVKRYKGIARVVCTVALTMQAFGSDCVYAIFIAVNIKEVVPLKNRMTKPAQFGSVCGVVNVAMIPDVFLYVIIGVFGYLAYGDNTRDPITLNMPQTGFAGDLIRFLLAVSVFAMYPICNYVVIELLWDKNLKLKLQDVKHRSKWEYAFRTAVTCANILFCIAVPSLELVMSLVGSLMVPALSLWFPAIMYTLTFWDEYRGIKFAFFLLRSSILLLTGVFALVVSVSITVFEIYETVL
ncbi:proton-coupled amino acid transporter-like protein acs isoform X2 [Bemisia tabaci]|uniref:proton-coupled amino acid transporter-like protein acs isoform X2 n=1 Tax=Bemisia tabaci TaxID=7038 RepID=UPI0008F9C14A|nr:PREDICTED: proton-coupled amino acid transporter-like protein CG1139 isoform X2 [Bemisia tabaci]